MSEKNTTEKKPTFLEKIAESVQSYTQKTLDYIPYIFVVSLAEILISSFVLQKLAVSTETNILVLLISIVPIPLMMTASAICFVLRVILGYRNLQRKKGNNELGYSKYLVTPSLFLVKKWKIWVYLGALLVLFITNKQLDFATVSQLTKEYNVVALGLFAIANSLIVSFVGYILYAFIIYNLFLQGFEKEIKNFLGFSIAPKLRFGLLTGGFTVCFGLMFVAGLIDIRVLELENALLYKMTEAMKTVDDTNPYNKVGL